MKFVRRIFSRSSRYIEGRSVRRTYLTQIAKVLNFSFDREVQVLGFQIDSRLVSYGDIFFALKGKKVDGHAFLKEAATRGAVGAIVDRRYSGPNHGLFLIFVEDVLFALQHLARVDLDESGARVIGVTGSVGKTTTKDFLAELLSAKYRVGKTFANYNTQLTLPLSILNREGGEEVFVLEMGMSDPGDIAQLLKIAQPEVAIVTQVALAHAASFPGGLADIAQEKASIFASPKLRIAVCAQELMRFPCFLEGIQKKVCFSLEDRSADYFLQLTEEGYAIDERGVRAYRFNLPFTQTHVVYNFLAAASAARQMQLQWDEMNARVPFLKLPKMRFEVLERQGVTLINDAYNANPESMRAALLNFPQPKEGGKRIGVLGVMSPLGSFSEQAHREIGFFAQKYVDHLLVFGEEARPLFETFQEAQKPAELFVDLEELVECLKKVVRPGDVVLVKGSRMMKMEMIFDLYSFHLKGTQKD